jgi:hypothetical protein
MDKAWAFSFLFWTLWSENKKSVHSKGKWFGTLAGDCFLTATWKELYFRLCFGSHTKYWHKKMKHDYLIRASKKKCEKAEKYRGRNHSRFHTALRHISLPVRLSPCKFPPWTKSFWWNMIEALLNFTKQAEAWRVWYCDMSTLCWMTQRSC